MITIFRLKLNKFISVLLTLVFVLGLIPSIGDKIGTTEAAGENPMHPYIYGTAEDFARIAALKDGGNPYITSWYGDIKLRAQNYKKVPVYAYPAEGRILSYGVESEKKIMTLAFVYLAEGDVTYAYKAKEELMYIASLSYWGNVLLDNSAVARAASVGYDWLYNYLTEDERASVAAAIKRNSLDTLLDIYRNPDNYKTWDNVTGTSQYGAIFGTGNHAAHNNTHYAVAALGIYDVYPELCEEILSNAIEREKAVLDSAFSDGVYNEGVGYWNYFLPPLMRMMSAYESSGREVPFKEYLNLIEKSAYFNIYTESYAGETVYGDMYTTGYPAAEELYYAGLLNNDTCLQKIMIQKENEDFLLLPIWFDTATDYENAYTNITRAAAYTEGNLSTMRTSWTDPYGAFVSLRGGRANSPHMDVSSGTFTYDALGERWTSPHGLEDYSLPGYWDYDDGGERWNYYARRAEGNNCIVINPDATPGQDVDATVQMSSLTRNNDTKSYLASLDLSAVYADYADSYTRSIELFDDSGVLSLRDDVSLKAPSELYWFMNTKADITINPDGKSAVLAIGEKRLIVEGISDSDFSFEIMDAKPLGTSPNPSGQLSGNESANNTGWRKLAIHFDNISQLNIEIKMTPLWSWQLSGSTDGLKTESIIADKSTYISSEAPQYVMKAQEYYRLQSGDKTSVIYCNFPLQEYQNKSIISAKLKLYAKSGDTLPAKLSARVSVSDNLNEDIIYAGHDISTAGLSVKEGSWLSGDEFIPVYIDVTEEVASYITSGKDNVSLGINSAYAYDSYMIAASARHSDFSKRPQLIIEYGG